MLQARFDHLQDIIRRAGSAVVAFSGGVDSTFLLKVCADVMGERVLAVTARSETFPARELTEAESLARRMAVRHMVIDSHELDVPGFAANPPDRCFLCKTELFSKVKAIADQHQLKWVFDGNNLDDTGDYRPGRKAARELGVRSPLIEAELKKREIRTLSRQLGLPTWDKPSFACLSSRFPYHSRITRPALRCIEDAEDYLWQLGMRVFRVRHHDQLARLELGEKEMAMLLDRHLTGPIVNFLKSLGYTYVTLDMEGYRSGSMNETLSRKAAGDEKEPPL